MRIISQDGMIDIPYERYCFGLYDRDTCRIIAWDSKRTNAIYPLMADYSSQEKAMKAMEMLRSVYTGMPVIFQNVEPSEDFERMLKRTKTNGIVAITDDKKSKIEYVNNMIFQFPKDEEIEV